MRRKRKSSSPFAFAVFAALILLSGYALNAAGYVDSPFDEMAFLSSWVNGGDQRFKSDFSGQAEAESISLTASAANASSIDLTGFSADDNTFDLPSLDTDVNASTDTQFTLPALDQLDNGQTDGTPGLSSSEFDEQEDIGYPADWSDMGSVLYDFWFICATTAVFIVVQWLFKFGKKQFKSRMPVVAAAK